MAQGNTKPRALGQNVDEQTVRADLENYQKLAQQWGASAAAIIPSSWVTIDERRIPLVARMKIMPFGSIVCTLEKIE